MTELLNSVRRRLRWTWVLATTAWVGPFVLAAALGVVLLGWLRPWAWPEPTALVLVVLTPLVVAGLAVAVRISTLLAARAADRGMRTRDAFAAAVELADEPGDLPDRVRTRAAQLASGATARDAVPRPKVPRSRLIGTSGLALLTMAAVFLPNPRDDDRAKAAEEARQRDAAAGEVRKAAEEMKKSEEEAEEDKAESLEELAKDLESASSIEEAKKLIEEMESKLQAEIPADQMAKKAATRGLDRSLEQTPLSPTSTGSAEEQLAAAAEQLDQMTPEQQAELAEKLKELAAGQQVGNPETAEALREAAEALEAGDSSAAQAALGKASASQSAAASSVASAEAAQEALDALADAEAALGAPVDGEAQEGAPGPPCPKDVDDHDDDGNVEEPDPDENCGNKGKPCPWDEDDHDDDGITEEADPDADCQPGQGGGQGQGQGQGSGSGQGQGQGQGQGGQNPSGQVGGGGATGSGGQGQGQGQVKPGSGSGDDPEQSNGRDGTSGEVDAEDGEQNNVGGRDSGQGQGSTVGKGNRAPARGMATVPPSLQDDMDNAGTATGRGSRNYSPTVADLIASFFAGLSGTDD